MKPKPQSSGPGLGYALFVISLALVFGIGYKVGRDSAPAPKASPAVASSPARPSASTSPSSPARARPRLEPVAEQPRMMWTSVGKPKYTLYLASFQKLADAEREKQRLESKGLRGVDITERRVPGSSGMPWYRIRYGTFDSREAAIAYGRQMTDRGLIRDFWPKELM